MGLLAMPLESDVVSPPLTHARDRSTERTVPVEQIHRSPYRAVAPAPDPSTLAGWLINPDTRNSILVRPRTPGGYELLIGEFEWRLAQAGRRETLSVRVLESADDRLAQQLAALDAEQDLKHLPYTATREGVLPWSGEAKLMMARAIQLLHQEQEWTLTGAARLFGLSRTEGAHYVRVLTLPSKVLELLAQGSLSFGQARALSRLSPWPTTALLLATKVAALPGTPARARRRACSVRELERRVSATLLRLERERWDGESKGETKADASDANRSSTRPVSGDLRRAAMRLSDHCGFPVRIEFDTRSRCGRLILEFTSIDGFQTLAELLAPGIDFEDE